MLKISVLFLSVHKYLQHHLEEKNLSVVNFWLYLISALSKFCEDKWGPLKSKWTAKLQKCPDNIRVSGYLKDGEA